jgi:UDP:flavonoid glycosyltransferase YjiC (YdhE family)
MSRFLLLPGNNTLSHIAKCLALREALEARGHQTFLAVSSGRSGFLDRLGERRRFFLPDIQEADGSPTPTLAWFRPARVEACVLAERALIQQLRPDAVLGVFRFTGRLSATLANVPYHSLICGSMTPACDEVLGFAPREPGADEQATALRFFRETCARRMAPAFSALGLAPVNDAWQLLEGQRTFLWDFPEFQPLPPRSDYHHAGPLHWAGWPTSEPAIDALSRLEGPMAYVALGTGHASVPQLGRLIEILWQQGLSVALALGGMSADGLPGASRKLAVFDFLPAAAALERAALVVCHGGQMLLFEAMARRLPVFVLPQQPEQAQNGRCVERMGCGQRLLRGVVYRGQSGVFGTSFLARPAAAVADEMSAFLGQARLREDLETSARAMASYRGMESLVAALEAA